MTDTPRADELLTALIAGEMAYEEFASLTDEHEREKALHVLLALLSDPDWRLRTRVSKALGVLGDRRAVDPLLESLEADENLPDIEGDLLYTRVEALVAIGDPVAILPLMLNTDISGDIDLFNMLLEFDKDDLLQVLGEAVKHPYDYLRELSLGLLGLIDDPRSIKLLIEALDDPHPRLASSAVIRLDLLKAVEAVPFLLPHTTDPAKDMRTSTVRTLGNMGDKQAIPTLLPLLNDKIREVRVLTAIALGKLGDSSGLDLIYDYTASEHKRYPGSHFGDVLKALRTLGEPLVPFLMRLDQRARLHRSVAHDALLLTADLLAEQGDPAALPVLESILESDNSRVRATAQQAIDRIRGQGT